MRKEKRDFKTPPIKDDFPNFRFPDYFEEKITDGVTLYLIEDKTQPLAGLAILTKRGSSDDSIPGVSSFAGGLLKRGTEKRDSKTIAEEIESLGTTVTASSKWDGFSLSSICLGENIEETAEILSDCYFNSTFPEKEIKSYRKKYLADLRQEEAEPSYLARVHFNKTLFRGHPYGKELLGNDESIKNITKKTCLDWKDELHSQKVAILGFGALEADKLREIADKYFINGKIKPRETKSREEFRLAEPPKFVVVKKDISQIILRIGKPTIRKNHKDFPALLLANTIFGGYFMSRLNSLLREELGYTYGINSSLISRKLGATFAITSSVNRDKVKDAFEKIIEEMDKIANGEIEDDEFQRVKKYALGSFLSMTETARAKASLLQSIILGDLNKSYYNDFYEKILSLEKEDIYRARNKYLQPENLLTLAVGDADYLLKELYDLGEPKIIEPAR